MKRLDRSAISELEGTIGDRWAIIRKSNHAEVKRLIDIGHSTNSIAKLIGSSRGMILTIMDELGIAKFDVSEGNRRAAAMMTEAERCGRAAAAHDAIRKIGRHTPTQAANSRRKQVSLDYVGVGESDLTEKLTAKGLHPVPQAAVEGYNIDILCDHLAVEVHNYTSRPANTTQTATRIVKLLSRGISVIYVQTGPHWPVITESAVNQVVAFYQETSSDPSPAGKYRVVRGDGQVDWATERHLDHLADVMATYSALKSR